VLAAKAEVLVWLLADNIVVEVVQGTVVHDGLLLRIVEKVLLS